MSKFWNFKNLNDEEAELRVEGEIISDDEAWIYEWFGIPAASPNAFKTELAAHKGKNITMWVDSWGGDVFAAMGIFNALKEHTGRVVAKITKGVSAGSIIPMAADEILITPGGIMMAHNPWTQAQGEYKDMIKAAEVLNEVKEAILNVYQGRTKADREYLSQMMNETTWMSAQKAVNEKFADGILYQDEGANPVQNDFSFSMLAIQNSTDSAMKRFFEGWQSINNAKPETQIQIKESDPVVDIKNIEDLKKAYPDLCNQIETAAAAKATTDERDRLKDIDSISATILPELVNKAKYEEPLTAANLALSALRNDAQRGVQHLNNREEELNANNGVQSDPNPAGNAAKEQEEAFKNSIAAAANRGRKKEGN